jgi:polyhydroxybutyrate depolymerase
VTSSTPGVGRLLGLIVSMAGLVAAGACGGSSHPSSSTAGPATTVSTSGIGSSGGCAPSASAAGSGTLSLPLGGGSRTVIVHVPSGLSPTAKTALVLNLHGSGSTAAEQEVFTGMDRTADADGFLVAYPQGLIPNGSGFDWNVPGVPLFGGRPVPAGAADDVSALTQLVTALEARYCIDPARVFATGFSDGARLSSQLACDASTTFAAVAPVSGLRRPTPCPGTRPVPIVAFHGTADPVDPYAGNGQAYWTYSVLQAAQLWAVQDACAGPAATSLPASGVTLTQYSGCHNGASVELYTIQGEGHEWPGGPTMPAALTRTLGPQSSTVDANTTMWAFFQAHPLR